MSDNSQSNSDRLDTDRSNTSQPNPVEDNADAEVQPISGKPSQAEGEEEEITLPGRPLDSDGS